MKLRRIAWVVAVSGCYVNPRATTTPARTTVEASDSGAKLVVRLAYTANTAAAAGDCATVKAIAPVAARADAATYHVTFEASPNIQDCLAGNTAPPVPTPAAPEPVASESAPPPTPAALEPVAAAPVPARELVPVTEIEPAPAIAPERPPQPFVSYARGPSRPWSAQRRFALALSGVGLATLGVSLWAVIDASGKRDQARQLGCSSDLSSCPAVALPTAQDAFSRGNLATATFIGGSALVAVGAYLWLTDPKPRVHVVPTAGPGNLGLAIGGGF